MASDEASFPKLNLTGQDVSHLDLTCSLAWEGEVEEVFRDVLEGRRLLAATKYRAGNARHLITQELLSMDADSPRLLVSVSYETGEFVPDSPVPKELRGDIGLVDRMGQLALPYTVRCHVHFEIRESDVTDRGMWFPLPFPTRGGEDGPIDEIRGVRGVKKMPSSDDLAYSFILDRPTNADVDLVLNFSLEGKLDYEAPSRALDRAIDVTGRLGLRRPIEKDQR